MSSETGEVLFHLTPTGWTMGVEPPDRVESWRRTVRDESWVSWRCDWVDISKANAERDALRAKFQVSKFTTSDR